MCTFFSAKYCRNSHGSILNSSDRPALSQLLCSLASANHVRLWFLLLFYPDCLPLLYHFFLISQTSLISRDSQPCYFMLSVVSAPHVKGICITNLVTSHNCVCYFTRIFVLFVFSYCFVSWKIPFQCFFSMCLSWFQKT